MKQIERRMGSDIAIECKLTLKEKLRVLFSNKFVVTVDLSFESSDGILESEYNILTLSK